MGTRLSAAVFHGLLVIACASTTSSAAVRLVASSEAAAEISADSYRVKLRFTPDPEMSVWSLLKDGTEEHIGSFPLAGFVRSNEDVCGSDVSAPQFMKVTKEMKNDGLQFAILYGSPGCDQHQVSLRFDRFFFSYSLSVVKGHPREITQLLYLARVENGGKINYGKGSFEQLRTWTPDLYDVLIPDVGLSRLSFPPRGGSDDPGYIRGQQAGSPLVGPYLIAVRSGRAWWGIGTIGIPNTYNGLGIVIGRYSFAVKYQTASQLSAQENRLDGPALGFYFGNDEDEILTSYRASLSPLKGRAGSSN